MLSRTVISAVVCLSLVAAAGCSNDPLAKVTVSGVVTFDGGPCPGPGRLTFSPIEVAEGLPIRPASGQFDTNGKYEATSFRPGDGVVPGRYRVSVVCVDISKLSTIPTDDEFRDATYVADGFEAPDLIVELGAGSMVYDLDVPRR